ncbi:MAG TPA: GNAT family N-acetyltransferase [Actinomycetota bacterium]
MIEQRVVASGVLTEDELAQMRGMFAAAWDRGFSEEDWDHTFGGLHVLRSVDGELVAHGAVAERTLWLDGAPLRVGYLEAVATWPAHQDRGHGSAVVRELDEIVRRDHQLGGLSTGRPSFYERLGWRRWRGSLAVRTAAGDVPTPEESGAIFVLPTPAIPDPDLDAALVCDWRNGDVW